MIFSCHQRDTRASKLNDLHIIWTFSDWSWNLNNNHKKISSKSYLKSGGNESIAKLRNTTEKWRINGTNKLDTYIQNVFACQHWWQRGNFYFVVVDILSLLADHLGWDVVSWGKICLSNLTSAFSNIYFWNNRSWPNISIFLMWLLKFNFKFRFILAKHFLNNNF